VSLWYYTTGGILAGNLQKSNLHEAHTLLILKTETKETEDKHYRGSYTQKTYKYHYLNKDVKTCLSTPCNKIECIKNGNQQQQDTRNQVYYSVVDFGHGKKQNKCDGDFFVPMVAFPILYHYPQKR
jgi:hypothetical protein